MAARWPRATLGSGGYEVRPPRVLAPDAEVAVLQRFDQFELGQHLAQVHDRRGVGRIVEHQLLHVILHAGRARVVRGQVRGDHGDHVGGVAQAPVVRFVHLDRDAVLGVPAHQGLRFGNRLAQRPRAAAIELRVPEERDGAPGVVDGLRQHRRPVHRVARAAVAAHERMVAEPGVGVDRGQVGFGADGHAAGAVGVRVHLGGTEEVLLGVLIGAERKHVEAFGAGDLDDAGDGFVHGRPAEMMAQAADRAPSSRCARPAFAAAACPGRRWFCSPRRKATTACLDVPLANVIWNRPDSWAMATHGSVPPNSQERSAWPRALALADNSSSRLRQFSGVRR